MYMTAGLASIKLKNTLHSLSGDGGSKDKLNIIYESPNDIKLDKDVLQKYFAYETYNTVHNYFRYKKPKIEDKKDNEEKAILELLEDDIDVAKPIPGTNEMLLYDKKTTNLIKKAVNFDKKKHKYLYFLDGCRSKLCLIN